MSATSAEFFCVATGDSALELRMQYYEQLEDEDKELVKQQLPQRWKHEAAKDCLRAERLLQVAEKIGAMTADQVSQHRHKLLKDCKDQHVGIAIARKLYPEGIPVDVICLLSDKHHKNHVPCARLLPEDDAKAIDKYLHHLASRGNASALYVTFGILQISKKIQKRYLLHCLSCAQDQEDQHGTIAGLVIRLRDYQRAKDYIEDWEARWQENRNILRAVQDLLFFLRCHKKITLSV